MNEPGDDTVDASDIKRILNTWHAENSENNGINGTACPQLFWTINSMVEKLHPEWLEPESSSSNSLGFSRSSNKKEHPKFENILQIWNP